MDDDKTKREYLDSETACPQSPILPERVGPYRILERLGEGGMGVVYLAEQTEPVRRKVALKIIKHGMDTKQVVARFEAERQALAMMDHPCVAKVFDAGATARGRPYFAMEYVRGVPLNEYCDRHLLSVDERLELFCQVCEGVQHAHQKGIIHRDIKPSNILVLIQDDRPAPKVIDFGLAKATQHRLTDHTLHTQLGVLVGTPEYMSPEQAEMTGLDVDTRTDVYSLGVVLYQLLVGALPFSPQDLREGGLDEIRRKIREDEPSRPSTRFASLGNASADSAQKRRTDPSGLRRELRGDLDWIAMKALEKDRTRRYGSPSELAADVVRHLTDQPVVARPPSVAYQAHKFVRRHRAAVAAAMFILLALVAGGVVSTWQFFRAESARREAEFRAYTASLAAAAAAHERNNPQTVRSHLESVATDLRGWEWDYLWHDSDRSLGTSLTLPWRESGYRMDLSPDGTLVAVRANGGIDEPVFVYETRTGEKLDELTTWSSSAALMTFSPDNRFLAYSASGLDSMEIWDLRSRKPVVRRDSERDYWSFLGFHPDGERVAVFDGTAGISIYRLTDWEKQSSFGESWTRTPVVGEFSADGRWLAVGSRESRDPTRIFDVATSELVRELGKGLAKPTFNADSSRLALLAARGPIVVYDTESWAETATLPRGDPWLGDLLFLEDGVEAQLVTSARDGILRFYGQDSPRVLSMVRGEATGSQSIAWDRDLDQIVTTHESGAVKRWARRRPRARYQDVASRALLFDGRDRLLAGIRGSDTDPRQVGVWAVGDGRLLQMLRQYPVSLVHDSQVVGIARSPDGRRLAVATASDWKQGRFKVYDLYSGLGVFVSGMFFQSDPRAIAWSPDGSQIGVAGDDGLARLYETETFRDYVPLRGHRGTVNALLFARDAPHVVTAGDDGTIRVWDTSGAELRSIAIPEGTAVTCAAISEDGRLVAGTARGEIHVLDVADGTELTRLSDHSARVSALALSPAGDRLVSGSADRTMVLWDTEHWRALLTLRFGTEITALAFDLEGTRLAVAEGSGKVEFLDARAEVEREQERALNSEARRVAESVVADLLERDADVSSAHERVRANDALTGGAREAAINALHEAAEKTNSAAYDSQRNHETAWYYVRWQILRDLMVLRNSKQSGWPEFRDAADRIRSLSELEPAEREAAAEWAAALRYTGDLFPDLLADGLWTEKAILETIYEPDRHEGDDHALALFAAESLHEAFPDNDRFFAVLGYAQYRAGLYRESANTLEAAVARAGAGEVLAETWAFLSMAQARLGRDAPAREALRGSESTVANERWRREVSGPALAKEARALLALPAAERASEGVSRVSLDVVAARLDVGNPDDPYALRALADRHAASGRPEQAERLHRKNLERTKELEGSESIPVAWAYVALASLLDDGGRYDEAETLLRDAVAIVRSVNGEGHYYVAVCLNRLGHNLMKQERLDEAEAAYRRSLELHREFYSPDHLRTALAMSALGGALTAQGQYDEAQSLLIPGYEALESTEFGAAVLDRLLTLYEAWEKPDELKQWQARKNRRPIG